MNTHNEQLREEWKESETCHELVFNIEGERRYEEVERRQEDVFNWFLSKFAAHDAELVKAFGGCTKCYGKGYGTTLEYATGRGIDYQLPRMNFCSCERGKSLKKEIALLRHTGEDNQTKS